MKNTKEEKFQDMCKRKLEERKEYLNKKDMEKLNKQLNNPKTEEEFFYSL